MLHRKRKICDGKESNFKCLERAGDFLGAMEEYKRAADNSPSNVSARYQLARMYIHLKYFDVYSIV